jgi:ribosomal protein L11 methyltransferase
MIRLALRVRREHAELVLAELLELAPSGVEEVDVGEGVVEYAVYGAPGELPTLPDLTAAAGGSLVEVTTSEIADDWSERWREFHTPLVLGERLTVRPPWEPPGSTEIDLVIDPGQAFGTGGHATTRLCLELMLSVAPGTGSFFDLGCGSGVLAVAAARLGWAPVVAADYDPVAVEATRRNAAVNKVAVQASRIDLRRDPLPAADTVAANLLAPLLLTLAPRLVHSEWPTRLIASGLLEHEADAVAEALAPAGLDEEGRLSRDGWSALLFARRHHSSRPSAHGQPARAEFWPRGG